MYVTTYPCNLCANKIVQAGIKKVVYFEPYPVEEAKKIFKEANVISEPFEGVTFRAFFKFFKKVEIFFKKSVDKRGGKCIIVQVVARRRA